MEGQNCEFHPYGAGGGNGTAGMSHMRPARLVIPKRDGLSDLNPPSPDPSPNGGSVSFP
jgi:hypothetical protein